MHAATAGDQANAWLGQGEHRVFGGDDDVAGQRGFEPAAHRHAVHRRNQRLVEIETMRQMPANPFGPFGRRLPAA